MANHCQRRNSRNPLLGEKIFFSSFLLIFFIFFYSLVDLLESSCKILHRGRGKRNVRSRTLKRERKRKRDTPAEDFLHFGRNGCSKLFQARVARGIAISRNTEADNRQRNARNSVARRWYRWKVRSERNASGKLARVKRGSLWLRSVTTND